MYMVSMVVDHHEKQWGNIGTWPLQQTVDVAEVLRKLGEIDKKLGAKDCHDPKKDELIKKLQARILELETALNETHDLASKALGKQ